MLVTISIALAAAALLSRPRRATVDPPRQQSPGPDGVIRVPPSEMAARAGVDLERYALARVCASEEYAGRVREKEAIAAAVVNAAAQANRSIVEQVTRGEKTNKHFFAKQNAGSRWCASHVDPRVEDLNAALVALGGSDPTAGAIQWDHPRAQAVAKADGVEGYRFGPDEIAQRRRAAGMELVDVVGIAPIRLRFWRRRTTVIS